MRYSSLKRKLAVICVFMALAVAGLIVALVNLQVVNGESYRDESENSITQSMQLSASRGDILDRYGRVLVTNEASYNVVISRSALLRQSDPNGTILRLIDVCDSFGVEHGDTLPISVEGSSVTLVGSHDSNDRFYFDKFLDYRGIDKEQPVREIYQQLLDRYDVSNTYTPEQRRMVVGVRYELELRTAISMPDYVFAADISTSLIAAINDAGIKAVSVQTSSKRVYKTQYAAQLLGFVGQIYAEEAQEYLGKGYSLNAYVGKSGAEKAFESYLHGTDGTQVIYTNSDGDITGIAESKEPVPGQNVALTIDINLQGVAERALESKVLYLRSSGEGSHAEGAAAVVIEVGTGDVLACASYPTYDANTYFEDYSSLLEQEVSPLLNRALNGYYEPGSTFKPVTATAALENGIISTNTYIYDKGVYDYFEDYQPVCWIYGSKGVTHGEENVSEAIRDSCNFFFYETGRLTGINLISQYAHAYGLGEKTGLEDAFYESDGVVASIEEREASGDTWNPGDTLQAAIGQSDNRFTPIQLANYIATLANHGVRCSTHLLSKVYSRDYSEVTYEYEPQVVDDMEMSNSTYDAITYGMFMVADSGTAMESFRNSSVTVAAKTGTAQVGKEANNAIFVCFAPYEDPQIAVSVVVEKGVSGAIVSTIAAEIVESYFSSKKDMVSYTPENQLMK